MDFNITSPCSSASVGVANQLFGLFIQSIFAAQCSISSPDMWPRDYGLDIKTTGLPDYDFIVIGAGTAGSVVANRLSENPNWNVLLLEAGGDPPIESEIPSLFFTLQKTAYDWNYYAEMSKVAGKSTPRGTFWPRGKLLGGSSGSNAMLYKRGIPQDYDNWEKMGNPGWGWKNVLEYFKKSEDNKNENFVGEYHGTGGLMKVDHMTIDDSIRDILRDASEELGYPQISAKTSEKLIGFTIIQSTAYKGTRWSTAKAFLNSAKDRNNLHIVKHAHVIKINFNKKKEVESVSFVRNGTEEYTVKIRKEVVLSAGAVNSPQLLLLSGIGPEKHLKKHGINIIKNLPVGLNLKDHMIVPLLFTLHESTATAMSKEEIMHNIYLYAMHRKGQLTGTGALTFNGMIDSTDTNSTIPDIQLHYLTFKRQSPELVVYLNMVGYEEQVIKQILAKNELYDIGYSAATLLRPESTGKIKLRSSIYDDKPMIYANYLTKQYDIDTLTRGIRKQIEFAKTKVFKKHEGSFMKISLPECDKIEYDSDAYWECYIRHIGTTIYHPTSSVKMGPENDKTSVVNSRLQVKGVKNLRVADASIMPMIVSGNTNAACIMIGEKASDLIKEDYSFTHEEL